MMQKTDKILKPWHIWYSDGTHLSALSGSYQINNNMTGLRFFKNRCVLVLQWTKVASAFEWLRFLVERHAGILLHLPTGNLYADMTETSHGRGPMTRPGEFIVPIKTHENLQAGVEKCTHTSFHLFLLLKPGSSRQGVGTENASSNFAASHYES